MIPEKLSEEEKGLLLDIARKSIEAAVNHLPPPGLELGKLPVSLQEFGVVFVTLTLHGKLRGCIGALEAYQPLAKDVQEHAASAATKDYRFPPVDKAELEDIHIEISRLTAPQPLDYQYPADLVHVLKPGIDGVILKYGSRRATFLPQVWQKVPLPQDFLGHLCQKMGASPDLWKEKLLDVSIYQVEEFHE